MCGFFKAGMGVICLVLSLLVSAHADTKLPPLDYRLLIPELEPEMSSILQKQLSLISIKLDPSCFDSLEQELVKFAPNELLYHGELTRSKQEPVELTDIHASILKSYQNGTRFLDDKKFHKKILLYVYQHYDFLLKSLIQLEWISDLTGLKKINPKFYLLILDKIKTLQQEKFKIKISCIPPDPSNPKENPPFAYGIKGYKGIKQIPLFEIALENSLVRRNLSKKAVRLAKLWIEHPLAQSEKISPELKSEIQSDWVNQYDLLLSDLKQDHRSFTHELLHLLEFDSTHYHVHAFYLTSSLEYQNLGFYDKLYTDRSMRSLDTVYACQQTIAPKIISTNAVIVDIHSIPFHLEDHFIEIFVNDRSLKPFFHEIFKNNKQLIQQHIATRDLFIKRIGKTALTTSFVACLTCLEAHHLIRENDDTYADFFGSMEYYNQLPEKKLKENISRCESLF